MDNWWAKFVGSWDWHEPMLVLGVVTILVTALIPVFIWRLGAKQSSRDSEMRQLQTETLDRQEMVLKRQRRDSLLTIIEASSDATHLGILWDEVREYEGPDRHMLIAVFRANVAVALPGTNAGLRVDEDLDDQAVADYIHGLERRYETDQTRYSAYDGLVPFLRHARGLGRRIDIAAIVSLVTGPTAEVQRPGHGLYRELVDLLPEIASGLLIRVEDIDYRASGGIRLNVLTGTLLGIKDAELGRLQANAVPQATAVSVLRDAVPGSLALLLHRDNLRSLDHWSLDGSTEPVSATVAWLIRAVGWLADTNDHLVMRMVQNLPDVIRSIPAAERGWGIDDKDVRQGFEWISQKQPELWKAHGEALENAASSIGKWVEAESGLSD